MPLYAQLKTQILRLLNGRKVPGQPFYTDHQLVEMFGVSRTTVREAVRELIQENYLYRVRGVGTFLASPVSHRLDRLQSYFKTWTEQGKTVSVEVKTAKWAQCPGWAASFLALPEGSKVFYVHRLRTADGIPIASDYRYLPADLAAHVSPEALRSKTIFEILAERVPNDPPASARFTVEAAAAPLADARALRIPTGAPVLVRTHLLISQSGRAISAGRSLFRADLAKWSIELPVGR
jgi:GntR family transcriptional regulator